MFKAVFGMVHLLIAHRTRILPQRPLLLLNGIALPGTTLLLLGSQAEEGRRRE
jgi:hypothetical protein